MRLRVLRTATRATGRQGNGKRECENKAREAGPRPCASEARPAKGPRLRLVTGPTIMRWPWARRRGLQADSDAERHNYGDPVLSRCYCLYFVFSGQNIPKYIVCLVAESCVRFLSHSLAHAASRASLAQSAPRQGRALVVFKASSAPAHERHILSLHFQESKAKAPSDIPNAGNRAPA